VMRQIRLRLTILLQSPICCYSPFHPAAAAPQVQLVRLALRALLAPLALRVQPVPLEHRAQRGFRGSQEQRVCLGCLARRDQTASRGPRVPRAAREQAVRRVPRAPPVPRVPTDSRAPLDPPVRLVKPGGRAPPEPRARAALAGLQARAACRAALEARDKAEPPASRA
jgi:hypothetical protein